MHLLEYSHFRFRAGTCSDRFQAVPNDSTLVAVVWNRNFPDRFRVLRSTSTIITVLVQCYVTRGAQLSKNTYFNPDFSSQLSYAMCFSIITQVDHQKIGK